ncbi:MAG: hypothetical protein ABI616_01475 [Pseudomonadota bacterium]
MCDNPRMQEVPVWAQRKGRWGWLRATAIIVFALVGLFLLLTLSRTPLTPVSRPPSSEEVDAARRVYGRVRVAQVQPRQHRIDVTWFELSAVAELGGRALGIDRMAFDRDGSGGRLAASMPLALGFWLNGHAYLQSDSGNNLRISARLGHLPLPAFLVHALVGLSRQLLELRGAQIPPLEQMVNHFEVNANGMGAIVDLPRKFRFFSTMSALRSGSIDPQRVELRYCQLAKQQKAQPDNDFAVHVSRAFTAGDGSVADNRAAFVALAMLFAGTDVGSLPVGPEAIIKRCGRIGGHVQLLGREDLVKHWSVSAALTSTFGAQASISIGTWKEVSDSGAGGSGFSLVDLAADRSGTYSALHGTEEDQAASVRQWLAGVSQAELLPVSALALAEGMTEAQFNSRYTSTDSSEFALSVQRIDDTLAVLSRY